MLLQYDGSKFRMDRDNLTSGEIAAVERVSGYRQAQIRAMANNCGCGHRLNDHALVDPDDLSKGRECTTCGCDDPAEDLPMDVNSAFMWVCLKRVRPEMSFADVQNIPLAEIEQVDEGDDLSEVDPADPTSGGEPLQVMVEDASTETTPPPADSSTSESSLNS